MQSTDPYYTSPLANEAGWSDNNLPPLLFQLEPPRNWGKAVLGAAHDEHGKEILDGAGRRRNAFPMLPAQISVQLEDWRLMMYTDRYDPRITIRDLTDRMHITKDAKPLSLSSLHSRKRRFRNKLDLACWAQHRTDKVSVGDCLLIEQLSEDQIKQNTVLAITPQGLIMPVTEGSTSPPTILPRGYFLHGTVEHTPSLWLKEVIKQVKVMQETASKLKLAHWIFLPNRHKPEHWMEVSQSHGFTMSGGQDIKFPFEKEISKRAMGAIKRQVQRAVADGTSYVPDYKVLPVHSHYWVKQCIAAGKALAANRSSVDAEETTVREVRQEDDWAGLDSLNRRGEAPPVSTFFQDNYFPPSPPSVDETLYADPPEQSVSAVVSVSPVYESPYPQLPQSAPTIEERLDSHYYANQLVPRAPVTDDNLFIDPSLLSNDDTNHRYPINMDMVEGSLAGDSELTPQEEEVVVQRIRELYPHPFEGKLRDPSSYNKYLR